MGKGLAGRDRPKVWTSAPSGTGAGFRRRASLDDSSQALQITRVAVANAQQGDEEAFRFLYLQYSDNVYGYVRSVVRDDYEAEDVTQHVFAKLITHIGKYDDRGLPFLAWLLRLARNAAIDHIRANRATPCEEVFSPNATCNSGVEDTLVIQEALATLPEEQRQVVFLRHVVGLSPVEIAGRMGRSESSIHGLHHRGRRALQKELTRLEATPSSLAVAA